MSEDPPKRTRSVRRQVITRLLMMTCGVALFVAGVSVNNVTDNRDSYIDHHGIETTATVLAVEHPGADASNGWLTVGFIDRDGTSVAVRIPANGTYSIHTGEQVPVRYDPIHSTRVRAVHSPANPSEDWTVPLMLGGLAFAIVGFVGLIRVRRKAPRDTAPVDAAVSNKGHLPHD